MGYIDDLKKRIKKYEEQEPKSAEAIKDLALEWARDRLIIEDQAKEIERLREALKNILSVKFYGEEGGYLESDSMRDIARAALKGDE